MRKFKGGYLLSAGNAVGTGFPVEVRIENTNLCNGRCVICPREKMTRPQGVMSSELFRKIIDECAASGAVRQVNIQGFGEPLLDPGFAEKVGYAKARGIARTYTVTNASLLFGDLLGDVVKSGLDKMKVSFYGTNEAEYASVHKGLDFETSRRNILALLEERKRQASRTPLIRVQYIGSLPKFISFFLQWRGKTSVGFNKLHNYGAGRDYVPVKLRKRPRRCSMVSRPIFQVLWNGDVVPCCYDFNGAIVLGNVARQTIDEVWNSQRYRAFRAAHASGEFSFYPLCFGCDKLR